MRRGLLAFGVLAGTGTAMTYAGLVTGVCPIDLNVGRRIRPLGPQTVRIKAPKSLVFEIIAAPYVERQPRAVAQKIQVLERGSDMVLAAHFTPISGRLRAKTVETVRFTPPDRIDFRLVRGPVPHVVETFTLTTEDDATILTYEGEMGSDLWALGERWADRVAVVWEATVATSLRGIADEAERRTSR